MKWSLSWYQVILDYCPALLIVRLLLCAFLKPHSDNTTLKTFFLKIPGTKPKHRWGEQRQKSVLMQCLYQLSLLGFYNDSRRKTLHVYAPVVNSSYKASVRQRSCKTESTGIYWPPRAPSSVPPLSCRSSAACWCTPGWVQRSLCCFWTDEPAEAPHRPSGWRGLLEALPSQITACANG